MANVYFIGNAHLDPVWLWRWQDGVRINGVKYGKQYIEKPGLGTGGVAFYDGNTEKTADRDARLWIEAIDIDINPVCKPDQAIVVTRILEAIYESSKTGKPVYFND